MSFLTNWKRCQKCGKMYITNRFDGELCGECEKPKQEPSDLIRRTDMLDAVGHGTTYTTEHLQKIINGLPSVNLCEDAVSRQAIMKLKKHNLPQGQFVSLYDIEQLPSVHPKAKTGHWISREGGGQVLPFWGKYQCSECGECAENNNFCPNCGAEMKGEQE